MLMHEQLKQARERAGLSQAKLGALTGLSRNQIVRAEAGENITIDTLRRILVHLPIDEVTLLERVRIKVHYLNLAENGERPPDDGRPTRGGYKEGEGPSK